MSHPVAKLLPYLVRHRQRFATGFIFLVLATGIQLLAPWVLKYAIDDLDAGVTRTKLGFYAAVIVGIALVGGVCRFLMRRIIIGVSREFEYDLRNDFFAHLQRLSLSYFQAHRTGDLMSRATNDLNAVRMMAGPAIMYSATTSIVFVVAVVLTVPDVTRAASVALGVGRGQVVRERNLSAVRTDPSTASPYERRGSGGVSRRAGRPRLLPRGG